MSITNSQYVIFSLGGQRLANRSEKSALQAIFLLRVHASSLLISAMNARPTTTTLIALAVSIVALTTTSFAQTAKNYSSGTVNVTPANVSTTTLNGVINSVSGTARVNITAPNVTVTTLSGGTLSVNSSSSTSSVSTTVKAIRGGSVKVYNRGTLNVSVPSGSAVNGSIAIANGGVAAFNQTVTGNYKGLISGVGQVRKTGTGLLILTGSNTYTGLTTVTAGTLRGNAISLRGNIANSAVVEFNQTSDGNYTGVISGTGQLNKLGAAVLTLTGANTYTGLTTVSAGTLAGNTTSLRGAIANSAIVEFNQTSNGTYTGVISGKGQLKKDGAAVLTLTGANTYTGLTTVIQGTLSGNTTSLRGAIVNSGVVRFNQTSNGNYTGVISGTGQLLKIGRAVLTLTGANTYTGLTTVSAGTLSGNTTSLRGDIANSGVVQFNQTSNGNYTGVISGTGQLSKIGTGVLILTGANTYTGLTTVTAGTLRGNTTSLRGAIANSAIVEFNQATNGTYAGVISGTGQLSKIGTGTVSLSGESSYKGSTGINAGALFIEGNQSNATGAVSVALGATLGGKGTVGGPTTIRSDGNHRIGASATGDQPGYQTFANALTYNAGSEVFWRLSANTTTAITAGVQNFDQAGVGTRLLISQSATFNLGFNSGGSTVDWSDSFWDLAKSNTAGWQIFNAAELIANGPTVFTLNPADQWRDSRGVRLSVARPDYTFAFYKDEANDDLYLNYIYSP